MFDQFPPVSTETWKAKVIADLKGADFDKKLVWRTNEGFNVQPMYRAEDIKDFKTTDSLPGEFPYVRGTRTDNEWYIRQNVVVEDVAAANAKATDLLTKGVTSLGFKVKDALSVEDMGKLLAGIDLEKTEINFESCPRNAVAMAKALVEYLESVGKAEVFKGSVKFDPFVRLLKHGLDFKGDLEAMAKELVAVAAPVKGLKLFTVDSVMLSKLDGDARGGAALSVKAVTGKPIKFVGMGEKLEDIEPFHPDRMASRILGMGDVLSLIEKAEKAYDAKKAAEMEEKLKSNRFTLQDFYDQMVQMKSMGSMEEILAQMPGGANLKGVKLDEKAMAHTEAIILSMTPKEREKPEIIGASRKKRIAAGAGVRVEDVNKLLKSFEQMRKLIKQFSGPGMGRKMKRMRGLGGLGGGFPGF